MLGLGGMRASPPEECKGPWRTDNLGFGVHRASEFAEVSELQVLQISKFILLCISHCADSVRRVEGAHLAKISPRDLRSARSPEGFQAMVRGQSPGARSDCGVVIETISLFRRNKQPRNWPPWNERSKSQRTCFLFVLPVFFVQASFPDVAPTSNPRYPVPLTNRHLESSASAPSLLFVGNIKPRRLEITSPHLVTVNKPSAASGPRKAASRIHVHSAT